MLVFTTIFDVSFLCVLVVSSLIVDTSVISKGLVVAAVTPSTTTSFVVVRTSLLCRFSPDVVIIIVVSVDAIAGVEDTIIVEVLIF